MRTDGRLMGKNPRALAGWLRRAQTSLRNLGIEISFSREGRSGIRMIRLSTSAEDTVSTVTIVSAAHGSGLGVDQCAVTPPTLQLGLRLVEHVAMTTLSVDDIEFGRRNFILARDGHVLPVSVCQTFLSRLRK
jgi:hypothetical protein